MQYSSSSIDDGDDARRDAGGLYLLKKWPRYCADDPYYTHNMRDYLEEAASYFRLVVNESSVSKLGGRDVLLVTQDLRPGGDARLVYDLAIQIVGKGNFATVLSPVEGELISEYKNGGIPVIISPSIFQDPLPQELRLVTSYDLIITDVVPLPKLTLMCKDRGVPIVVLVHDSAGLRRQLDEGNAASARGIGIADVVVFRSDIEASQCRDCGGGNNFEVLNWERGGSDGGETGLSDSTRAFGDAFVEMIGRRLSVDLVTK